MVLADVKELMLIALSVIMAGWLSTKKFSSVGIRF